MVSAHSTGPFPLQRGARSAYASAGRRVVDCEPVDYIVEVERAASKMLAGQPEVSLAEEIPGEVVGFRAAGTAADHFDLEGGGGAAGLADFELHTKAGQLKSLVIELRVEDFRDLGPLQRAANNF